MRLFAALTVATLLGLASAGAQSYPRQTVNIVVPLPPGSIPDMLSRILADKLTKSWSTPVVVINRPGAGLNIGARSVAMQPFPTDRSRDQRPPQYAWWMYRFPVHQREPTRDHPEGRRHYGPFA